MCIKYFQLGITYTFTSGNMAIPAATCVMSYVFLMYGNIEQTMGANNN